MRVTRRVLINAVGFLVLGTFLSLLFAVQILPTVFGSSFRVSAIFPDAGGVFTNQEVTYRGVQIGRVGEMTIIQEGVNIEMVIEARYDKIPKESTRARILYKSAVGEQFIDILPETNEPPYFEGGETIPLALTSIPIQTEDLLRDLEQVLSSINPEHLGSVINELGLGLGEHGSDIKQLILALDVLSKVGADNAELIAAGTTAGAGVQDAFNSTSKEFVAASDSLNRVSKVLSNRRSDFGSALKSTDLFDKEIIALLKNRKAELKQVLGDLAEITRITHAQRDDLNNALRYLGPFFGNIYEAYSAPYFMFNLLSGNTEQPSCHYSPSSRPIRPIGETGFKQPETNFACPDTFDPQSTDFSYTPPESLLSDPLPSISTTGDQLSWLHLYKVR